MERLGPNLYVYGVKYPSKHFQCFALIELSYINMGIFEGFRKDYAYMRIW